MIRQPFQPPIRVDPNSIIGDGWVWLCIPKNASRSLQSVLQPLGVSPPVPDGTPLHAFAFLRDPVDRIASVWRNKIRDAPRPKDQRIFERWPDLRRGMPLGEFVAWLADGHLTKNRHWLPQARYVTSQSGTVIAQTLAPIDRIAETLDALGIHAGSIPQLNSTETREDICPTACEAIRDLYAEDYRLLASI